MAKQVRKLDSMMTFNCSHLFALRPPRGHVSLTEVRDVYEIARYIPQKTHREAFYASQGLDMQRVEEILPRLETLNSSLNASAQIPIFELSLAKYRIKIYRSDHIDI